MEAMQRIQEFLGLRRFAFAGVSRQPQDFSRNLFREFLKRGYQPVPVHPEAKEIEGQRCFASLLEIQPPVEGVLFMTPPDLTDRLAHDCVAAGIPHVWIYRAGGEGAARPETVRYCEANGISVVPGECPFMFFSGGAWVHRVHGFVRRITGSYPR
jgi:predicted CoA-binding protein